MKYNMTAKVFAIAFSGMLSKYYKKHFPEINFKPYKKAVKKEYKEMVMRTPGIGGIKKNSLESNLIGACYFFAMAKKIPDMTPQLMDKIVDECMASDFMVKIHKGQRKKGTLFSDKVQDKKVKEADLSQKSDLEMDWKYTYTKGKDEFFYKYTKCGVCRLAERENVKEYLPSMCRMDYPKFRLSGGKLTREKTLANGDEYCDFHVERIKES